MNNYHETVLPDEAVEVLNVKPGGLYVDGTLGNGGHSEKILEMGGRVIGIDLDPKMIEISVKRLAKYGGKFIPVNGNFKDIDQIVLSKKIEYVDGVLLDLGVTNIHLKDLERGFSFGNPDADLDMRLNPEMQGVKAADLLNVLREDQLRDLFEITLDPGPAKWLTGRVLFSRSQKPIKTVGDALEICEGLKVGKYGLNEATLPFLALRIAVNSELDNLKEVLPKILNILSTGGRMAVISFHSKEDSIVKDFFKESLSIGSQITYKPILATEAEQISNRRSRSAKLRVFEKK